MISIIIRTKNEERWIGSCLEAVFSQTRKDFEVILVDNVSTDKTVDKAANYGVKVVTIEKFTPGAAINRGIEREGAFYLFSLRMIAVIPFWLLTLLMGVTPIGIWRFFLATAAGMLPIVVVLVHFGTQLGAIESFSLRSVFTPGLLTALALLGILPFATRRLVALIKRSRVVPGVD